MLTKEKLPPCPVAAVYSEVPPRVEYSLSPLGETMKPIIDILGEWGLIISVW